MHEEGMRAWLDGRPFVRQLTGGRILADTVPYRIIGYSLIAALLACVAIAVYARSVAGLLWAVALVGITREAFVLSRRERAPGADDATAADGRRPVLYLRPFTIDAQVAVVGPSTVTFEELVAPEIERAVGPMVALGDPADHLPTLGAAKAYERDDTWRAYVARMAERACCVLLVEGTTEGLRWELEHLRKAADPGRLMLLTLPAAFTDAHAAAWPGFQRLLAECGFGTHEDPGAGAVIGFDREWRPSILCIGADSGKAYASAIARHLEHPKAKAVAPSPAPARKQLPALLAPMIALLVALGIDFATKLWVQSAVAPAGGTMKVIEGVLDLRIAHDVGPAWGVVASLGRGLGYAVLWVLLAIVAVAASAVLFRFMRRFQTPMHWAVGLALGGFLGNVVDRVRFGYVVDFVSLRLPIGSGYQWPSFNVADVCIAVGIGLVTLQLAINLAWRRRLRLVATAPASPPARARRAAAGG
jgi:signal peptidase II